MCQGFLDISLPITEQLAHWPGDPAVKIARVTEGEPAVSHIELGSHTGTHVDPPAHVIPGGATVDELPLHVLIGPAWVADLGGHERVTAATLEDAGIPPDTARLLIRTANSDANRGTGAFDPDFVALTPDAAEWLLARAVQLVGIDGPSIEPYSSAEERVHQALLEAGVIVVENLVLAGVPTGAYRLICLPLRLAGGDGAPARVVLSKELTYG